MLRWKTIFIIHAPYLPFLKSVLFHIFFCHSDYTHGLRLTRLYFNQNHVFVNRIFFNPFFEPLEIIRFRFLTFTENVISEYKKFLNEKFQELGIGKYEKNMDNIFETLMNGGSPKLAIRYERRIIKNGEGKT